MPLGRGGMRADGSSLPPADPPLRLLLVDDDAVRLAELGAALHDLPADTVQAATEPGQVLARCSEAPVAAVVLNLDLRSVDAWELLSALHRVAGARPPAVLALTRPHWHAVDLERALKLGAQDVASRTLGPRELRWRVGQLLAAQRVRARLHACETAIEQAHRQQVDMLDAACQRQLQMLGQVAAYRDGGAGRHVERMSHIAVVLARASGWPVRDSDRLLAAAPTHDLGKVGVPDRILLKSGQLDRQEWAVLRTHPEIGARLLDGSGCELLAMARDIAWTHHEHWDGTGYPRGLRADEIPPAGRLCALADVVDALLHGRPHRRAWPLEEVLRYVRGGSGRHFEPRLVEVLLDSLAEVLAVQARFPEPSAADAGRGGGSGAGAA